MYASNLNIDDFVRDSQRGTQVVISAKRLHAMLHTIKVELVELVSLIFPFAFIKSIFSFIITILAIPITFIVLCVVVPLLWLFFRYLRNRLQNKLITDIRLNSDTYAYYRKKHDVMSSYLSTLKDIKDIDLKGVSFFLRFLLKEIQNIIKVMYKGHDNLQAAFDDLDANIAPSSLNVFTPISSQKLWANRPKIYQYRL